MPLAALIIRWIATLALGGLGGWVAVQLALPLPWMIGAMATTTAAAIGGLRISLPITLRQVFVAVLGVMLGSTFTPELFSRVGEWTLSLGMVAAYVTVAGILGTAYLARVAGYDRTTAYFAAMPGGLSEMVLVGSAMGGDERVIALTQSARLLLVVLILPFALRFVLDYDGSRPAISQTLASLPLQDLAILAACGVVGVIGGRKLGLPGGALVGPMALSAAVHLSGLSAESPPAELVAAAQVVIGSSIGARFAGTSPRFVGRAIAIAGGLAAIMVALSLGFALLVSWMTGLGATGLFLAYAPGGLAEMSLIALALSIEAAMVGLHHVFRIVLIVLAAPLLFGRFRGSSGQNAAPPRKPKR